jgi:hypothetical protein
MYRLEVIASTPCPAPAPARLTTLFEVSSRAAEHNANLLSAVDYDVTRFLETQHGTTLDFGSGFRPIEKL